MEGGFTGEVGEGGFAAGEAQAGETGGFAAGGCAGPQGGAGEGCAEERGRHGGLVLLWVVCCTSVQLKLGELEVS